MNFWFSSLAGLLSGVAASMGLGGGGFLLIYLTIFASVGQYKAQGINLLFFLPIAVLSVIIYAVRKSIKWKSVLIAGLSGTIGALGGYFLSSLIGSELLGKIFGGFLLILGAVELFRKPSKKSNTK